MRERETERETERERESERERRDPEELAALRSLYVLALRWFVPVCESVYACKCCVRMCACVCRRVLGSNIERTTIHTLHTHPSRTIPKSISLA